ncbi:MAG: hypothetical protein IJH83_09420 [Coriobacteriales bacterium]|nr:hypothetical protein [Coriobacteriales bacterium]
MYVYLSHRSALEYWRSGAPLIAGNGPIRSIDDYPMNILQLDSTPRMNLVLPGMPESDIFSQLPPAVRKPIHVLVDYDFIRRNSSRMRCHVFKESLPQGQFVVVADEIAISSPELTFLQLAPKLYLVKLVLLGLELCGYYSIDPSLERGYRQHQPYSSFTKLWDLIWGLDYIVTSKIQRAMACITDGVASPMEARLVATLCLPYRNGGYAVPVPLANERILLSDNTRQTYGWSSCTCDLFWPDARFAVEYQGKDHDEPETASKDVQKALILRAEGIECMAVDYAQLVDAGKRAAFAEMVAKHVGKRVRPTIADFDERRIALGKKLGF